MGRPKALLPWGESTLIAWQIEELRAAGVDDVVVVLGHDAETIRTAVPPSARIVINEGYEQGRASSLRVGAATLDDAADPIIILSVDQPRPREVHERLLTSHRESGALITVPVSGEKRGHPVVLAGVLLGELREASEERLGLHGVLEAHASEVREHPFVMLAHESMANEPDLTALMVRIDINTPQDHEDALAVFGLGNGRLPRPLP